MWERQEVQEVLPPVRIFPALPTKSAVRKLPYGPARSAVTQIHGPHDAFDDPCAPRCPMSRHRKDPLRPLTPDERIALTRLSRSPSAPAAQVERARALLAIADGASYTAAARQIGRRYNETISAWVSRFNRDGLAAVQPRHGGGPRLCYGIDEQQRILAEMARTPEREPDGTATWSLSLLQKALRQAPDGAARGQHLYDLAHPARGRPELAEEPHLVRNRRSDAQAQARGRGARQRSRCSGQKKLIEQAYTLGAQLGLSVWCEDEAGPFQAVPHSGVSWQP